MLTKKDILDEIRKTAKENNGIPLGVERFKSETGIAVYDWMKYWPRFGDAQREAGFTPNSLNGAYSIDHLFEEYISLIRELGKLPVRGDLVVKEHNDPNFPTHSTFQRIGTKQQLLSKLLKYAEEKEYNDVIKLCTEALEKVSVSQDIDTGESIVGSVYLVKSGRYYKIGRTNSMDRRHHEIRIILPEDLILIHEIKTDDPSGIEAYWHKRFESKRKNGEWFDLNSSDIKAFKRWRRIL